MKFKLVIVTLFISFYINGQHSFSGHVDTNKWQNDVYLSVIEDYRKVSGIHSEQIIAKTYADSSGYFHFTGDQLETNNRIYRIHVDNCDDNNQNLNHFDANCDDSSEILFIANHNDTIQFPFSFDNEMFCDIKSNNETTNAFIKIDSLKNEMRFAYSEFRSEANRKLNNKKWFKTLQKFGEQLNEPIAELYIYAFLSDRTNDLHSYYLEDLKSNSYYDELLQRLTEKYPNTSYTKQYKSELNSDKYILLENKDSNTFDWTYVLYILLGLSVLANFWFILSRRKERNNKTSKLKEQLTKQEEKILSLLLDDKTNKEIADVLFVSVSTVKTHINNLYKKLKVQSREDVKRLFNK